MPVREYYRFCRVSNEQTAARLERENKMGVKMKSIELAREVLWEAFIADADFKRVYVDNVASYLYDRGIADENRNIVAEGIVDLIFHSV